MICVYFGARAWVLEVFVVEGVRGGNALLGIVVQHLG